MNNIRTMKDVFDRRLSGIKVEPRHLDTIMRKAKGDVKVKKKLSFALTFIVILIVTAAAAFAAISFGWTDAAYFLSKERTEGAYETWSGTEKVELIRSLIENGYIAESKDTERLLSSSISDEKRSTLADSMITQWLSCSNESVSFFTIVTKVWGEFRFWSLEQKAWFTQTLVDANVQQPDFEKYVLPDSGVLSLNSAKKLAIVHTEIWLELPKGTISEDGITYDYVIFPQKKLLADQTTIETTDGASPVWLMEMHWIDKDGQGDYCFVEIDPESGEIDLQDYLGKVMYDRFGVDWNQDEAAQAIGKLFSEYQYGSFLTWSLEERARWSNIVRPLVYAKEMLVPDFYPEIIKALCHYQYGIPDSDAITDGEAQRIAQNYLVSKSSLDENVAALLEPFVDLYDITAADAPIWRFHYAMPMRYAAETLDDLYSIVIYTIEVDAYTGEIVQYVENQLNDETLNNKLLLWM